MEKAKRQMDTPNVPQLFNQDACSGMRGIQKVVSKPKSQLDCQYNVTVMLTNTSVHAALFKIYK